VEVSPATAKSLREQVYAQIRRMVMLGEFPSGHRLTEAHIAARLKVSRTPVREAFARLHADHLLQRFGDGGFFVAELNLLELRDLYELRLVLEVRGLSRGLETGVIHDRAALMTLREHWQDIQRAVPETDGSFIELDESFHVELLQSSGNFALSETLETVNARIRPVRMYDFLSEDRIATSIQEHLAIVDAALDEDFNLAVDRLREHIGASLDVVERRAAEAMYERKLRTRRRRHETTGVSLR